MFGEQAVAGFKKDGIDVSYVFRDGKEPSGVALIFVAKDGENSIAVASGANAALAPSDIRKAKEALTSATTVVFQLETPLETVEAAAKVAKKAGARVILNPAPAAKLPATLLCCVSILTPNETEAELLTGIKVQDAETAGEAAKKLQALGVETVVITLGSKGAFYQDKDQQGLIPAFKVKAVDTTAAGDVFNGALAVALTEGRELKQALRFASAAAAISVTRLGAQPSAPTRKEIEKFLKSH
jgi:ribokinase